MSIRDFVIRAIVVSAAGLPVLMSGCVSASGDLQATRLNASLVVYAPFDNERDWGPSYLADSPDRRSNSQATGTASADPSKSPPIPGQAQTPPPQPLP